MEITQIVLPGLKKIISGRIMWDSGSPFLLIPYQVFKSKNTLAHVFNFDITLFNAIKRPGLQQDLPGPLVPGVVIKEVKTTFNFFLGEDGTNSYMSFTVENIPFFLDEFFIEINVTGNILKREPPTLPQGEYAEIVFSSADAVSAYSADTLLINSDGIITDVDIAVQLIATS